MLAAESPCGRCAPAPSLLCMSPPVAVAHDAHVDHQHVVASPSTADPAVVSVADVIVPSVATDVGHVYQASMRSAPVPDSMRERERFLRSHVNTYVMRDDDHIGRAPALDLRL